MNNAEAIILQANEHISNINRLLKGVKSDVLADFVYSNNKEVVITTNKIVVTSNLNIVEKYLKKLNNVDLDDIMSPWLSQLKLYLKILEVFYFLENANLLIMSDIIDIVIKKSHIFNDIILASCPYVIKSSPKSDIAVI